MIARLRAAGAVILGRTNMTEFAYSGIGLNPHYGTPGNPADRTRVPGGSSAGAAVSVADRNSGRIYGRRNAADVTIGVIPQADGSLRVQFDAKNLGPQDQGLEDRFVQAYKRRMGH